MSEHFRCGWGWLVRTACLEDVGGERKGAAGELLRTDERSRLSKEWYGGVPYTLRKKADRVF